MALYQCNERQVGLAEARLRKNNRFHEKNTTHTKPVKPPRVARDARARKRENKRTSHDAKAASPRADERPNF